MKTSIGCRMLDVGGGGDSENVVELILTLLIQLLFVWMMIGELCKWVEFVVVIFGNYYTFQLLPILAISN